MYGTLYKSSEDYDYDYNVIHYDAIDEPAKQCLICWLPSDKHTPVKYMKTISYYLSNCQCNALLHEKCLTTWLQMNLSCPICRNKVSLFCLNTNNGKYIIITKLTIIFVSYVSHIFTVVFLSFITYFMIYVIYTIIFSDINIAYNLEYTTDDNKG